MRIRRRAIALTLVLALPAAGALYQTLSVRRDGARFPAPGLLVDVGGRRLHLVCIGEGRPAVIFETSAFSSAVSFPAARAEIAARTRVCSYDRMGTGWSDPGPAVISIGLLAGDLERLLERAVTPAPYIIEAASMGGLVAELFARRHPERVAGLVFVDAGHSTALEYVAGRVTPTMTAAAALLPAAARLGLLRLIDPLGLRRQSGDAAEAIWRIYRAAPMATVSGLARGLPISLREFRDATPLAGDVPMTVLTAETTEGLIPGAYAAEAPILARDWRAMHQQLARRSSHGTWRLVAGSNHLIGNSQPHAVAAAVLEMLDRVRTRE